MDWTNGDKATEGEEPEGKETAGGGTAGGGTEGEGTELVYNLLNFPIHFSSYCSLP